MKYKVHTSDTGEETVFITQVVHTIRMGDVEDPDLFVAQPIYYSYFNFQNVNCLCVRYALI